MCAAVPVCHGTVSRIPLLAFEMEASYELLRQRLAGVTDEEYLWEPVRRRTGPVRVRRTALTIGHAVGCTVPVVPRE